tara:strand:+ start:59388 stop:59909 length:522 start_codon:yes stop_codon:yes gene_type:complete
MPKNTDSAKRKKQLMLIAVLAVGLLIAVLTQPETKPDAVSDSPASNTGTELEISSVALQGDRQGANDTGAADLQAALERFALRELSRIELHELQQRTLFRVRPVDSGSSGALRPSEGPIRVEAVYGSSSEGHSMGTTEGGSALIGNAIVRPGQTLPDGRKIVDITSDGIAIAK